MSLAIERFGDFFKELWGYAPFPWQARLAKQVHENGWPNCIDLPTASGKTACIDVAVFVLACQASRPGHVRTVGRRVFFAVNRRVIVDEAFDRAFRLAERLLKTVIENESGVLREVADALLEISGDDQAPPLDVAQLRGGIYRDRAWARSITQPIVVCTTADQLGSRLLFRGYGVSPCMQPVHAALTACDSLILLDEAHVTRAFCQTMGLLTKYQRVRMDDASAVPPMRFVQMTATPVDAEDRFELDNEDLANPVIAARQNAPKSARLVKADKKSKSICDKIVELSTPAKDGDALIKECNSLKAIGIIVNRVQTAREISAQLAEKHGSGNVILVIGRMRPIDRDDLQDRLRMLVGPARSEVLDNPVFVVATQCLEVGADYDFDALITECASIDALRQRFGRLNRRGRPIEAVAAIVADPESIKGDDPIYGDAIKHTWEWLTENGRNEVDFGLLAFKKLWDCVDAPERQEMLAPAPDAAVLLPAHLDALCQTNPQPAPSPDVSYFIHGPERDMAEVNVCWRADLGADDETAERRWREIVRLLPPTSPECMTVPLWEVRRWMQGRSKEDNDNRDADVAVASDTAESKPKQDSRPSERRVVVWRGAKDCDVARSPNELRPGDTVVIRTQDFGWEALGHISNAPTQEEFEKLRGQTDEAAAKTLADHERRCNVIDVAERATRDTRLRVVRRLHRAFDGAESLRGLSDSDLRAKLIELSDDKIPAHWNDTPVARLERHPYPGSSEEAPDEVIVFKRLLDPPKRLVVPAADEDDGEDNLSELLFDRPEAEKGGRNRPPSLDEHTQHVVERVDAVLPQLSLNGIAHAVSEAARLHDLGKADIRFQAMLAGLTPYEAIERPVLLGKGDATRRTQAERQRFFDRAMYPRGFRHEMLSVELIEHLKLEANLPHRDLLLHLVAAHHGYARPFAPVCIDDAADDQLRAIRFNGQDIPGHLRRAWTPSHRLDSGVAERFWALTRRHGWWGLAWLESILRLADQQASAAEQDQSSKFTQMARSEERQ